MPQYIIVHFPNRGNRRQHPIGRHFFASYFDGPLNDDSGRKEGGSRRGANYVQRRLQYCAFSCHYQNIYMYIGTYIHLRVFMVIAVG